MTGSPATVLFMPAAPLRCPPAPAPRPLEPRLCASRRRIAVEPKQMLSEFYWRSAAALADDAVGHGADAEPGQRHGMRWITKSVRELGRHLPGRRQPLMDDAAALEHVGLARTVPRSPRAPSIRTARSTRGGRTCFWTFPLCATAISGVMQRRALVRRPWCRFSFADRASQ